MVTSKKTLFDFKNKTLSATIKINYHSEAMVGQVGMYQYHIDEVRIVSVNTIEGSPVKYEDGMFEAIEDSLDIYDLLG